MLKFTVCMFCLLCISLSQNSQAQSLEKENHGFLGIGFSYLNGRGFDSFDGGGIDLSIGKQYGGTPLILGCETMFGASGSFGILGFTGYLRLQSEGKHFLPYFEVLAGLRSLWTPSDYEDYDDDDRGYRFIGDVLSGPWAPNAGFGAGFLLPVTKAIDSKRIFIDFNLKYMFGGAPYDYTGNSYVFRIGITFR